MGGSEEGKSVKAEKSPPPTIGPEQGNVHIYPDWAAVQAYYGPRVAMPQYYNPAVASGHPPPPYMWGHQPMMPPYGAPYAAIYAPGGVYAHPGVPLGTQVHGQAGSSPAVSDAPVATPLSIDTPVKSSGNADKGLMKKLKGFDGLAMSIGNGNGTTEKADGSAENRTSESSETDGSSNGSDGNTEEADHKKRKRSREVTSSNAEDEQSESKPPRRVADKVMGIPVAPADATAGQVMGIVAPNVPTALDLLNPGIDIKGSLTIVSPSSTAMSSEPWMQNEKELKRERRKQSNRESARRSRLRKQAEVEKLAKKVDALNAENFALRSEITTLVENSKKLRLENVALQDKLKGLECEGDEETAVDVKHINPTDSTENLLSRVNNGGSVSRNNSEEGTDVYEKSKKSGGSKFHQLLSSSARADAVAAG